MAGGVALLFSHEASGRKEMVGMAKRLRAAGLRTASEGKGSGSGGSGGKGQTGADYYCDFAGCVALAPLVTLSKLPPPVMAVLTWVAAWFPHRLVPRALEVPIPDDATWLKDSVIAWHMTHDVWGVPGGLGWGRAMRWGSAVGLIALSDALVALLGPPVPGGGKGAGAKRKARDGGRLGGAAERLAAFPLVVLHDPGDRITAFSGSRLLVDRQDRPVPPTGASGTELRHGASGGEAVGGEAVLVAMEGCRHDLMVNEPERVARAVLAFATGDDVHDAAGPL